MKDFRTTLSNNGNFLQVLSDYTFYTALKEKRPHPSCVETSEQKGVGSLLKSRGPKSVFFASLGLKKMDLKKVQMLLWPPPTF